MARQHDPKLRRMTRRSRRTLAVAAWMFAPLSASMALATTDDHWINGSGGTWAVDSNWNLGVAPVTTNYNGIVDLQTANAYQVRIVNDLSVNSITLNSTNATIVQSASVNTSTLTLNAGTYLLNGGNLVGATINQAGGIFSISSGALDNATVTGGDLQVSQNGSLIVRNGLTIANHNLDLGQGSVLYFDGANPTASNLNITTPDGYANIDVGGPNSGGPATLTLSSTTSVSGGFRFYEYYGGSALINNGTLNGTSGTYGAYVTNSSFTNYGTAEATSGGSFYIQPSIFTNRGKVIADGGSVYVNAGNWTNAGTFTAIGGTLSLGGSFATSDIGSLSLDANSNLLIAGSLNNTNATLRPSGGTWKLAGGTITNGTIDQSIQQFVIQAGTLDGVTVTGGDLQLQQGATLNIRNGLTVANKNLAIGSGSVVYFDGVNPTVNNLNITTPGGVAYLYAGGPSSGGPATLTLGSTTSVTGGFQFYDYYSGSTLINSGTLNANNTTYLGYVGTTNFINSGIAEATGGASLYLQSGSFTNNGNVIANGSSVYINAGSWSNAGTFTATGGTLSLGGSFATSDIGKLSLDASSNLLITGKLNNTNATLRPAGGTWTLYGGTISGGTIDQTLQPLIPLIGTLDGVTVTGSDLQVPQYGRLTVRNGLTIANHNLGLGFGAQLTFDGVSSTVANLNIAALSGSATIYVGGPNSLGPATLTLDSSTSVTGGAQFYDYYNGSSLINNGTINSTNTTYANYVSTSNFINNGVAEATAGSSLYIQSGSFTNNGNLLANGSSVYVNAGSWTNAGTFTATGGTLSLGGNFATSDIGSVSLDANSNLLITGKLNNTNATLRPSGGTWSLVNGTITRGTIDQSVQQLVIQNGTFDGVTVTGSDLQLPQYSTLTVRNGLTIANKNLDLGFGTNLYFDGVNSTASNLNITTPGGYANIYAGGPTSNGPATLTVDSTTAASGGFRFYDYYGGSSLINNGTLNATGNVNNPAVINTTNFINNGIAEATTAGSALYIQPSTFSNTGTLLAASGGLLEIRTPITGSSLGYFSTSGGTGTISLGPNGILQNAGGTTTLTDILTLNGGTISGGTLTTTGNGQLAVGGGGGVLDGVTLATALTVNGNLSIYHDLTLANANISLGDYSTLSFAYAQTQAITGSGQVRLRGINSLLNLNNGTLTLGPNVSVIGSGTNNSYIGGSGVLFNNGTISAATGNTLILNSGALNNSGTLLAQSGGTISLRSSFNGGSLGYFSTSGGTGTVELSYGGILQNASATTTLTDILTLNGGTISGGTLTTTGNGQLAVGTGGGVLDGVTLGTDLTVNGSLSIYHDLTLAGANISLGDYSSLNFAYAQTQSIGGNGNVLLRGINSTLNLNTGTLTIGPNVSVLGSGTNNSYLSGSGVLINSGTLSAARGDTLILNAGSLTNSGTLLAQSGGTISIRSSVTGSNLGYFSTSGGTGTVEIGYGGILQNASGTAALTDVLTLNGGTISGGTLTTTGNGQLAVGTNGGVLDGVTLGTDLSVNGPLSINHDLTLANANISLGDYSTLTFAYTQAQSIVGNGAIRLRGLSSALGLSNGTLTIGPNISVIGSGTNNSYITGSGALINTGTITAAVGDTLIFNAGTLTNSGTLLAQSGGTILLGGAIKSGGLGYFSTSGNAGTVELSGTLYNSGTTTILSDTLRFVGGTISGGTLTVTGNGRLSQTYGYAGTLDGVTLASSTIPLDGGAFIANGLTLSNATLSLVGIPNNPGVINFIGTNEAISGTGTILLPKSASINGVGPIGSGVTIVGNEAGFTNFNFSGNSLVNNGTIIATSGNTFSFSGVDYPNNGTLTNNGTLDAQRGGTISLSSVTIAPGKLGYFATHGGAGTVELRNSTLLNDNTTTTLSDILTLNNGTISGGTLTTSGTGSLLGGTGGGTLKSVALGADFRIPDNVRVTGGLTLFKDTLTLASGSLSIDNTGSFNVTGTAQVVQSGSSTATIASPLVIASKAGDTAAYTISGGALTGQKSVIVGSSGNGNFTQTGGATTITGVLAGGNTGALTSGNGTAVISVSGGSLYADTVLLGSTAGGSGDMTVSGTANVTIGGGLHLNDLTVNGGSVTVLNQAPPAGEDPELYKAIVGGYLSNGALNVNGGAVISPLLKLGITTGKTGTFSETGGSVSLNTLSVGSDGTLTSGSGIGIANITGGSLYADTVLLGSTAGGSGDMTVSGSASVTVGGGLHLNDLNVNGGTVTVLNQAPPSGEDPELNRAIVGGYLTNGALNVNGGVVNSPMLKLGITSGKTGTFTETAGSGSFSTLSVGSDGTLTSGSGIGIANISGGTLYADTVLLGSTAGGSGDMTVSGSAKVTVGGGLHLNDLTVNGGSVVVLDQTPPASEDAELNRAIVGGYLTNGALIVNGGAVTAPYVKLGITSGKTGTFNLTGGASILTGLYVANDVSPRTAAGIGIANFTGGSLSVGSILVGSAAGGVGSLNISGTAAVEVSKALTVASGSRLVMTGGTLALDPGVVFAPADPCIIGNGSTAARVYIHNATVSSSGSKLTIASNATLYGGDSISGNAVGYATFSGTSLALSGSSAVLHLAVGGSPAAGNAGVTYDQITESNATFSTGGATLQLLPISGLVLNQPYPIIVATSGGTIDYSQVFSNLTVDPTYTSGGSYAVSYSPTEIDVTFSAVPEPTSTAVILAAACLMRRRRKPLTVESL